MQTKILKRFCLLCFIVCIIFCNSGFAQEPPDTTTWHISELSSPDAVFPVVQQRANSYFAAHPEMDSINPLEKMAFKRWEDFWRNRANINGNSQPGKLTDVLNAMYNNSLYSYQQDLTAITLPSKWMLISPDELETQNLGTVTAIWSDPNNEKFILIGTETSGLWKTTDGGLNWANISDTYSMTNTSYMTAAGFGVSSIAVNPNNTSEIYIATFLPNTDLVFGHGANILKSVDGGATWNVLSAFNTYISANSSTYYKNMVWKILLYEGNLYAAIGKRLIVYDPNTTNYNQLFELGIDAYNYLNPDCINVYNEAMIGFPLCRKIRDFEIIRLTSGDFKICLTTDGIGMFAGANAEIYHTQHINNPFTISYNWTRINLTPAHNGFIDNAAVEAYNNTFYIAYDEKTLSGTAYFKIDILINNGLINFFNHTHDFYMHYPDEHYVTSSIHGGLFNGFGYRYDAFKVIDNNIMYVGGFDVTKIDLSSTPTLLIPITYATNPLMGLTQNFNKNNYCHNGIRVITLFKIQGSNIQFLVGNEGGISKFNGCFYDNLNGKGLAITEFASMTTTHKNNRDVIVASAIRNGIWHYENGENNNQWRQFYFEDGGTSLIYENNPNLIYNISAWWDASAPGYAAHLISGSFQKTNPNSPPPTLYYIQTPIANPAPVSPSFTTQINLSGGVSGYYPPLEQDPNLPFAIYTGKHELLYSSDFGQTWATIYNFPCTNPSISNWDRSIQAVKVANSGTCGNRKYVAFADPTWGLDEDGSNPGTDPQRKLWRQIFNGTWTDLTKFVRLGTGPYTLAYNGITDIAINPENGCELWITLNQFCAYTTGEGKERVMHSTDGGNTWAEYSQGLTPAPVNSIKYFSDNGITQLFIGTDVGVYYRDPDNTASTWQLLNSPTNPLPRCIVTDIEISYQTKKLRAATLGRGIWETDILCLNGTPKYTNLNDATTPTNTVWNTTQYSSGIYIGTNQILTITSNVRFAQNATVFINPGGKLILDGGVLEACPDNMWAGVTIAGTPETDPDDFIEANHGIIQIINNGTIKDAIIGIRNYYYGVIYLNKGNFINNQRAILMDKVTGNNRTEKSYFYNGNFTTNSLYHNQTTYPFQAFIDLNNVYKLYISGCKFENKMPGLNNLWLINGKGIKSFNSIFNVCDRCNNPVLTLPGTPCPPQYLTSSNFINLDYGIYAYSTNIIKNFTVKNTTFDNNYRGIFAMNIYNASFTLNTFKVTNVPLEPFNQVSYIGAYGLYLMDCSGYTVEANLFDKTNNAQWASLGMLVFNSGSPINTIYNNTFHNIKFVATLAQGINRSTDFNLGLKIRCNDYWNNNQDIGVTGFLGNEGISKYQGANVTNPADPDKDKKPAGNIFSKNGSIGLIDIDNTMGQNISYFYHNDYGDPNNLWVPQYCNPTPNITKSEVPLSNYNKALSCPAVAAATGNIQPNDYSLLSQSFDQSTLNYNSSKLILQIWVDGGNTPDLVQTTKLAYPWEAYTLYNELIGLSPYLSDDVLIATIQNEDGLPALMLKLVLLANPQAVRSNKVMDALYKRNNPFPEEWIVELKQGLEMISPLENLEADVSYYAAERKTYQDLLKQYYLADTTATALQDLQQLLAAETDIDSRYELIFAKLANNEYQAANTILENMESTLPENDMEVSKYYKMRDILPIIEQLNSGEATWETIDKSKVIDLSENNDELPGALAKAIRMHYDESYTYAEPIYVNENIELKTAATDKINKPVAKTDKHSFKVSPNPANDFVVISYELNKNMNGLRLIICNALGKIVYEKGLNKPKDELLISLKDFVKGNYIATLFNNGNVINSAKIVVQ